MQTRHTGTAVGTFYATLTSTTQVGVGSIIIFDRVWYNTGEYSPNSGTFICPVTGVYVFSFTVTTSRDTWSVVDLFIDSTAVATGYVPLVSAQVSTTSVTVVVSCSQYSEVMVKYNQGSGSVYGFNFSLFSGFLLWAS